MIPFAVGVDTYNLLAIIISKNFVIELFLAVHNLQPPRMEDSLSGADKE